MYARQYQFAYTHIGFHDDQCSQINGRKDSMNLAEIEQITYDLSAILTNTVLVTQKSV